MSYKSEFGARTTEKKKMVTLHTSQEKVGVREGSEGVEKERRNVCVKEVVGDRRVGVCGDRMDRIGTEVMWRSAGEYMGIMDGWREEVDWVRR